MARKGRTPVVPSEKLPAWQQAILRLVAPLKDVAGVFVQGDAPGTCEVYWVVEEVFTPAADQVLKKEHLLRKEFPDIRFYFHIWAHQGRAPQQTVPRGLTPLFVRQAI